jgi:hypothetical protein
LDNIRSLTDGQLWRHNVAGDLPGVNNRINQTELDRLVKANKGKKGFTYTHKPMLVSQGTTAKIARDNRKAVRRANKEGFTINLSANNLDEVDKLTKLKIAPVATVLPADSKEDVITEGGNRVKVCPAYLRDTSCEKCGLCQKVNRKFAIGFPAHGTLKNVATKIANGNG